MRYEQAKPLLEKLMNIAVRYHGAPSLLRGKIYHELDMFLPDLDEGCRATGEKIGLFYDRNSGTLSECELNKLEEL